MNRTITYRILALLMWLAVPLTALSYWAAWDQLPARMASHFDLYGQPNGWMPRDTSLGFALGLTVFMLLIFTGMGFMMRKQHVPDAVSWAFLGFAYVIMAFIYRVNRSVVDFNLTGRPVEVGPMLVAVPFVIVIFMGIYLATKRGPELPKAVLLAEEEHSSRLWALVFLIPLAIEVGLFLMVPLVPVKFGAIALGIVFLCCFAFAWNGFQYRFSRAGVEVRTLGFRLRSIPLDQIRQYTVEPWAIWRGYGIRGIGRYRAYVWGNRVVHITTPEGDVFLGHSHPERIVRDLDMIRGLAP